MASESIRGITLASGDNAQRTASKVLQASLARTLLPHQAADGLVRNQPGADGHPRHGAGALAGVEPLLDGSQAVGLPVLSPHRVHHHLLHVRPSFPAFYEKRFSFDLCDILLDWRLCKLEFCDA